MHIFRNEETDKVNLYESSIESIKFEDSALKIIFVVDWLESEENLNIVCKYCNLMDFCFKQIDSNVNVPTIVGFSYLKEGQEYTVQINLDYFGPVGYIRLKCTEFYFEVPSLPLEIGGNNHCIPWDPVKMKEPLGFCGD
jgi:hypothetical protein